MRDTVWGAQEGRVKGGVSTEVTAGWVPYGVLA